MVEDVDWKAYFESIQTQCPWSIQAYLKGQLHIQQYQGLTQPLGQFTARILVVDLEPSELEALCEQLDQDDTECEWLFSYPGYGPWATPVSVLIQQSRSQLEALRSRLKS